MEYTVNANRKLKSKYSYDVSLALEEIIFAAHRRNYRIWIDWGLRRDFRIIHVISADLYVR